MTFLKIEILSVLSATMTNLLSIITFSTDHWSHIIYDVVKLHSYAKWIIMEGQVNGNWNIINLTNITDIDSNIQYRSSSFVIGLENDSMLYNMHQGLFRQCNYLSSNIQSTLQIPVCKSLTQSNNQHDDIIHGLMNPGRELIRVNNIASSCAILIILLLCACTIVGIAIGLLNNIVLATMTVAIIYLVICVFTIFVITIMNSLLKRERKKTHCFSLEILTDELCSSRSIDSSYSFILCYILVILCFITSILWLLLQEKQRKFAQHV